jgi:hypothetical protein
LFYSSGSTFPVGSIPIARSTLEAMPGHAGLQDWGQDIDPLGKSWESTLRGGGLMASRIPRIAPGFTRTVTRGSSQ